MKKIFSLIISLAFLTFSAFAAPVMVDTVNETAEELSFVDFKEVAKLEVQADYGEPMARSILEVAVAIKDSGYDGCDEYMKVIVKRILEICGENV